MTELEVSKGLDEKYCESCGSIIKTQAEICPKCGVRQKRAGGSKDKTTAILLALFLGSIGGHKFYLGQVGMGVVYLLFCWTFIPAVVAIIELIWYITLSDDAFAEKFPG